MAAQAFVALSFELRAGLEVSVGSQAISCLFMRAHAYEIIMYLGFRKVSWPKQAE